ncbi:MAG TPA: hypothetical protein VEA19_06845 [Actinomycetota bacterium]|nr:hypothetical protein [Actinomycetota bacterium]
MRRSTSLVAGLAAILAACIDTSELPGATDEPSPTIQLPSPGPTVAPSPTEIPTLPPCDDPPRLKLPGWIPEDLPLPKGTTAMQQLDPVAGYERALLTVPIILDEFIDFVLRRWPKKGWVLGVGDVEPGEVEDQFSRGKAFGAFKAQAVYCAPGYTIVYLIYAKDGPDTPQQPGIPSPRGRPLVPSASPSG